MNELYSICFVMPAWRRYALSEICFTQRKMMCVELAARGIRADVVVIADDENLDIARELGFHTVVRDNEYLGRKFNDGHEFAMKSGYDFSIPVGSDMFIDADLFTRLDGKFTKSVYYAVVTPHGHKMATMYLEWGILQAIPTRLLTNVDGRPCVDEVVKGCDTLTRNRIKNNNKQRPFEIATMKSHQYECVSFQSVTQVTKFHKLTELPDVKVVFGATDLLLEPLKEWYPPNLVDKVIDYYVSRMSLKA